MADFTGTGQGDTLTGSESDDLIRGLAGGDQLDGRGGNDRIEGGDGHDVLRGGLGNDVLLGGDGDDELGYDDAESDQLFGEAGNDILRYSVNPVAGAPVVVLDGGTGDDRLSHWQPWSVPPGSGTAALIGGAGVDRITTVGGTQVTIDAGIDADIVEISVYNTDYQIALGSGSDLLRIDSFQFADVSDKKVVISDFAAGDGGDTLDFLLFVAHQALTWNFTDNPFASGFLRLQQVGADAVLQFDRDGNASTNDFKDFVVLQGVAVGSLTARNLGGYAANGAAVAGVAVDGSSATDFFGGTSGNDVLRGLDGDDYVFGGVGADAIAGGGGNDILDGQLGDDVVYGGEGYDTLSDTLEGSDQLYGEGGNDTIAVDRQWFPMPDDVVRIDGGDGYDSLSFRSGLLRHDAIIIGGAGGDGINVYLGRNVTIDAGTGDDYVTFDVGIGNALITLGPGSDMVAPTMYIAPPVAFTITDFEVGNGGDKFYLYSALYTLLSGWDQVTNPFALNYLRVGRAGADAVLLYDASGEGTSYNVLARLAGVDAGLLTSFNIGYTFGTVAIVGTSGADSLVGTGAADQLMGLTGDDKLYGGGGADVMIGGAGDDWYYVDNAGDAVFELYASGNDRILAGLSYALGAGQQVEILTTSDNFATTAINLTGNELANVIFGNAGANVLDGASGVDSLIGLAGNDWYFVDNTLDSVTERAGEGTLDRVSASVSYTLGAGVQVEMLTTADNLATTAINLTGNELVQFIYGNAGANVLDGRGGADVLVGFEGNDWFFVDNALDDVRESAGGGALDRVFAGVSYALGAGVQVEMLTTSDNLATTAINLTGNELGQYIYGNAGANVLDGRGGADVLVGLGGDDWFFVDNALDDVRESAGGGALDRVFAGVSYALGAGVQVEMLTTSDNLATTAINLTGNELGQYIYGNAGANVLDGADGGDVLVGLGGADSFRFSSALAGAVDTISDFNVTDDTIVLDDAVFAGLATGALAASAFHIGSSAGDAADRVIYNSASGALYFDADGNGAGVMAQFTTLTAGLALTQADFLVI